MEGLGSVEGSTTSRKGTREREPEEWRLSNDDILYPSVKPRALET